MPFISSVLHLPKAESLVNALHACRVQGQVTHVFNLPPPGSLCFTIPSRSRGNGPSCPRGSKHPTLNDSVRVGLLEPETLNIRYLDYLGCCGLLFGPFSNRRSLSSVCSDGVL